MDAQATTWIHAAMTIFKRLDEDPEGAIRDTLHLLSDPALDHAFGRIRGGPSTEQKCLPPVESPALAGSQSDALTIPPAAPASTIIGVGHLLEDSGPAPTDAAGMPNVADLQDRITELETAKLDAVAARTNAENECAVLRRRVEQLESANYGMTETIAQLHQQARPPRLAVKKKADAKADREKAEEMDKAIEYEDAPPASRLPPPASSDDLLDTFAVAHLVGVKATSLCTVVKRHKDFPRPIGKRGKGQKFRRAEIEAWIAGRQQAPAPGDAKTDSGLIDSKEICKLMGGVSRTTVYYYRKHSGFPGVVKRIGLSNYFRRAEVEAWIRQRAEARQPKSAIRNHEDLRQLCGCPEAGPGALLPLGERAESPPQQEPPAD